MAVVCIITARAEIWRKLSVLSEMYKPSNFLEKINLYFKIYIPRLENKSALAISQSIMDMFAMTSEAMVILRAACFGEQDYLRSTRGSLLCPPLLLLAPRPLHPYLRPHWLFPFSSHGAILSPYLRSLSLSPSPLCPLSLLFSEPCHESFSCLLSFLT